MRPVTRRGRAGTSPNPVLASVAIVALLVTGCGSPPEPARVTVRNVAFDPRELHVVAGDEVAWFFDDGGTYHDVVVEGLDGNAGFRAEGEHRMVFPEPGIYRVTCSIHPQMVGSVVVRPPA